MRRGQRGPNPERRGAIGNRVCDRAGSGQGRVGVRRDFLDQSDAIRLGGVELVPGQQPSHRIAPAGLPRQPQGRTAERVDAAQHLDLGELGVFRRYPDVGGQEQFDAEGQAPTLGRGDDGLRPVAVEAPWITSTLGSGQITTGHIGGDVDEIEPRGEVVAMSEQHPDPQVLVGFEKSVGEREIGEHRDVERVAFLRTVESDQQDVAVPMQRQSVEGRLGRHGGSQRLFAKLCKAS